MLPLNLVDPKIEDYAKIHGDPESQLLKELREETYANMELAQMLSGPMQGQVLKQIACMIQAKRILEIGMFTGYSTLCFAEGMAAGGTILTTDINPQAIAIARKYFDRSPYAQQITIMEGPALESLKSINLSPPFDLVFIDADKGNYLNYYKTVLPMVRTNGVILVDNVLWSGRVLDPQSDMDKTIVAFNDYIKSDNQISKVMLPLRDGIFVLCKK
jgi:caffeoyl-CoA O-methyltransferase